MDCARPRLRFFALAFLALAACSNAPSPDRVADDGDVRAADIIALRWLAPGADKVAFLTTLPPGCEAERDLDDIVRGSNDALLPGRTLGRIAFESPVLLGGAASRSGLSCASCHLNGRDNPVFFIEGVSGAAGTADVTNSILSKTRGDGTFNPVKIPDLGLRDGAQMRERDTIPFHDKMQGLVAEEFDGGAPPPRAMRFMLSYLDSLEPGACEAAPSRLPSGMDDLDAALTAALAAEGHPSLGPNERIFWLRVARNRLERIHERMAGPDLKPVRDRLLAMSASLAAAADKARAGEWPITLDKAAWLQLDMAVREANAKSLYNPDVLRAALAP